MSLTIEIIHGLISPAVMVSANGLLCLAFYSRLSNVVGRGRAVNRERVDLMRELESLSIEERQRPCESLLQRRFAVLNATMDQLLKRARCVRRVLCCLISAILCLLACSLCLGLAAVFASLSNVALMFLVLGTLLMMLGGATALEELYFSLDPLAFETAQLDPTTILKFEMPSGGLVANALDMMCRHCGQQMPAQVPPELAEQHA